MRADSKLVRALEDFIKENEQILMEIPIEQLILKILIIKYFDGCFAK